MDRYKCPACRGQGLGCCAYTGIVNPHALEDLPPADDTDRTVRWTGRVIPLHDDEPHLARVEAHEHALMTDAYDDAYGSLA